MVQYLINNFEGKSVIYVRIGWIDERSSYFFAHIAKNNVYLIHGGARQLAI